MIEQLSSQPSPEHTKRPIDALPLDSPDLHYLYNYLDLTIGTNTTDQYSLVARAQIKYGIENVRIDTAMREGKHVPIPHTYGIYVNAKRWTELNPVQESSQEVTPSV